MSNTSRRTWLCLLLLFPAACQARVGTHEPPRTTQGPSLDGENEGGLPVPEMVRLPGGTFRTQVDPGKKIKPEDCIISAFWIGRYEVTFEQFDRFCQDTGYYLQRYHGIDRPLAPFMRAAIERAMSEKGSAPASETAATGEGLLRGYPVIQVCWLDAMAYCLWLTEKTGIAFRLPTQAEWEYACTVGGSEAPPAGPAELDQVAWCEINRRHGAPQTQIHPVGRKRPNRAGLYDMYGNVWEWCLDGPEEPGHPQAIQEWDRIRKSLTPWDMTRPSPDIEPVSSLFRSRKALRGGAWGEPADRVSLSYRMFYPLNYAADRVGFRVVCDANPGGAATRLEAASPEKTRGVRQEQTRASLPDKTANLQDRLAQLQTQIDGLTQRYQALLADDFSAYPVLDWHDELQTLQARYEGMLTYRKRTNQMRDNLPSAERQEFFRLRTLYGGNHLASYTKTEKEYVLVLLAQPNSRVPLAGEEREKRLAQITAKETATRAELKQLNDSTSLSPELRKRAQIDGEIEARVDMLEAALRKIEPEEAVGIGHQLQVLRYHRRRLEDPQALGRAALEDIPDRLIEEPGFVD